MLATTISEFRGAEQCHWHQHVSASHFSSNPRELIDDILQILPETRNLFVVTGSGAFGAFWQTELKHDLERDRNRLTFIWSEDLSYEQVMQRAANLPPHSAIFSIAAGTFATGSWQGDERTLADLSARANAPVFGVPGVWLGAGIVGGRLRNIDNLGAITTDVVMRILDGESPGRIRIPPRSIGLPVFDARQLHRWNISEARLPAGSDVRFRGPSLWRDYRGVVLGVLAVLLAQALPIGGLLYQRRARRRAEVDSRRSLALAADANRRVTNVRADGFDRARPRPAAQLDSAQRESRRADDVVQPRDTRDGTGDPRRHRKSRRSRHRNRRTASDDASKPRTRYEAD
jgi:hypothetical protein